MRKLLLGAFMGALLMLSVPVVAHHVTEPTAAVVATRMSIFEYNNRPATLLKCDGTDLVTFNTMRIEVDVDGSGQPSEHWDEWLTLTKFDANGKNDVVEWQVKWRHTNIPPHEGGKLPNGLIRWESNESSQRLNDYAPGTILRFDSRVQGRESGVMLNQSCTFTVG